MSATIRISPLKVALVIQKMNIKNLGSNYLGTVMPNKIDKSKNIEDKFSKNI